MIEHAQMQECRSFIYQKVVGNDTTNLNLHIQEQTVKCTSPLDTQMKWPHLVTRYHKNLTPYWVDINLKKLHHSYINNLL